MEDVYVVNLDRDVEKWEEIQKQFTMMKLTRVSAIDGGQAKDKPFLMNKMMHGCLQSHRKIWRMVVDNNRPALVLEDDCMPVHHDFNGMFKRLMTTLPTDYDVAIFGYLMSDVNRDYLATAIAAPILKRRCMRKVNEDWYVPGIFMGSHCYLITPQGANKLLKDKTNYHVDCVICRNKEIKLYCVKNTIATQKLFGSIQYNPYTTLEWIMVEPIIGLGSFTIRSIHIVLLYIVSIMVFLMSKSVVLNTTAKIIVMYTFMHYISTIVHISHNLAHDKTSNHIDYNNKRQKTLFVLNDSFCVLTIIYLLYIGLKRKILIPIIDLMIIATVVRILIIHYTPSLKDPSGICEEKSVSKYSLSEYCGSLRVSGHIMFSVLLICIAPRIGIVFFLLQFFFIMASTSHYLGDILWGVLVMLIVILLFKPKKLDPILLSNWNDLKNKKIKL